MADEKNTVSDLSDLKDIAGDAPGGDAATIAESTAPLREQELDQHGRAYATGRRKDAVARVWIKPGKGTITIFENTGEPPLLSPASGLHSSQGASDVVAGRRHAWQEPLPAQGNPAHAR